MSASLANDRRARPNVFGSSTTDISPRDFELFLLKPNRDHVADDDRACALRLERDVFARQLIERAAPHLLVRPRRVDDDGGRSVSPPPAVDEVARDGCRA